MAHDRIEMTLDEVISADWRPAGRIKSSSVGKVKAELADADGESGGTIARVRASGGSKGNLALPGRVKKQSAKGSGKGGQSKGRLVRRTIVKQKKGKGAKGLSKGSSKIIVRGGLKGSTKGDYKGSTKVRSKSNAKGNAKGSAQGGAKGIVKGRGKGSNNGRAKGSNKGDGKGSERGKGFSLWGGVRSLKGSGKKMMIAGGSSGKLRPRGKGKAKGKGKSSKGKNGNEAKAGGRGYSGGRGVGRGKGLAKPMDDAMRVNRLGGISKKGRGGSKSAKGRGKGLALATITKSLGKSSGRTTPRANITNGEGKGKGKGKGEERRSQSWGPSGDTRESVEPLDRLTPEDRRMMKKITIVAQLDKVPKPPAAMQGISLGKPGRPSNNAGSLSSRFGANFDR